MAKRRKVTLDPLTVKLLGGKDRLMRDKEMRLKMGLYTRVAGVLRYPITVEWKWEKESLVECWSKFVRPYVVMWFYYVEDDTSKKVAKNT